jgi:2-haloacid dehalogenase
MIIAFDAYGTLFDVTSAARRLAGQTPALADIWPALAADWRARQLEYTWQRAIRGCHADFATVTADALDWAMARHGVDAAHRAALLALYDRLDTFPEVPGVLARLAGHDLCILSNGTPAMLRAACDSAAITGHFRALISVEEAGVYKPARAAYALVAARMGPGPAVLVSSNGWDASAAADFGFRTVWVNRGGLPPDRLPGRPAAVMPDLSGLAAWV